MTEAQISLLKTLCALRWMALMKQDYMAAEVLSNNIIYAQGMS